VPQPDPLSAVLAAAVSAGFDAVESPQPLVVAAAAGAWPQPAGSVVPDVASVAAGVSSASAAPPPERLRRYATTSLPAGTIVTISHPSLDFSVSLAASADAS
jgi:hypothetical protein